MAKKKKSKKKTKPVKDAMHMMTGGRMMKDSEMNKMKKKMDKEKYHASRGKY